MRRAWWFVICTDLLILQLASHRSRMALAAPRHLAVALGAERRTGLHGLDEGSRDGLYEIGAHLPLAGRWFLGLLFPWGQALSREIIIQWLT